MLVADHCEVGPVDPACALPDPQACEDVSRNQVRSSAWLKNCRADCWTWDPRGSDQLSASSRLKLSSWRLREVSNERLEALAHSPDGARAAPGLLQRALTLGPAHRDLAVLLDHGAGKLHHRRDSPALGEVNLFAQLDQPLALGLLVDGNRGVRAHPLRVALVGDEPDIARLASCSPIVRHDVLLTVVTLVGFERFAGRLGFEAYGARRGRLAYRTGCCLAHPRWGAY